VIGGVIRGLFKGRWHGGDRLTELEAADLFDVSRTPVREALVELASMGVVELKRNCGAILQPFGVREVRDLYAVRSLLEVEATRRAATRIKEEQVDRLQRAFEKLRREHRPDTEWKLDRELHAVIAQASGNPRLAGDIARYATLVQTMREAVGHTIADIHPASLAEHLRILRCLKQRNPEAAAEAMRRHLIQASDSAAKAVAALVSQH
jgi:DNA-binding GntR family transcriptional regulator